MKLRLRERLPDVNWKRAGRVARHVANVGVSAGITAAAWYVSDSPRFSPLASPLANAGTSNLLRHVREIRDSATQNASSTGEFGADVLYGALLIGASLGSCVAQEHDPRMLAIANALCYATTGKTISEVGFDIADTPKKVWGITLNNFLKKWEAKPRSEELPTSASPPVSDVSVLPSQPSPPKNPDLNALMQLTKEQQKQLDAMGRLLESMNRVLPVDAPHVQSERDELRDLRGELELLRLRQIPQETELKALRVQLQVQQATQDELIKSAVVSVAPASSHRPSEEATEPKLEGDEKGKGRLTVPERERSVVPQGGAAESSRAGASSGALTPSAVGWRPLERDRTILRVRSASSLRRTSFAPASGSRPATRER